MRHSGAKPRFRFSVLAVLGQLNEPDTTLFLALPVPDKVCVMTEDNRTEATDAKTLRRVVVRGDNRLAGARRPGQSGNRSLRGLWLDKRPRNNQKKTQAVDESRLAKPYMVERVQPTTLLLGSSRVEVGFDPNSAGWPASMRPVFNLGMPGSGPYEQYACCSTR